MEKAEPTRLWVPQQKLQLGKGGGLLSFKYEEQVRKQLL